MIAEPQGLVPTRSLTLWGGVNMSGLRRGNTTKVPYGLGTCGVPALCITSSLAAKMVCSWKLVKAYQQTRQSTYICPPAPHVIEAFNHKVNHDTHKELGAQERAVLQYTCALQYVSYCNDERYKDQVAPVVKAFWDEVAEPFGSRALQNLDLSHIVGRAMHPNRTAKIPDYGVRDHIALVCGPFLHR